MIKLLLFIISISVFAIIPGTSREDLSSIVLKAQFTRFGFALGGHCTATAISEKKILTAGHCVKNYILSRPKFLKIKINNKSYGINHISVPNGFVELQKQYDASIKDKNSFKLILKDLSKIDIAIITLSKTLRKSIDKVKIAQLNSSSKEVLLCGYGYSLYEPDTYSQNVPAKLLCGSNRYFSKGGLLFIKGNIVSPSHTEALTAPGDSGSPLFDSNMNQIGVLSGITKNDSGDATSYYANLMNLKEFIIDNI